VPQLTVYEVLFILAFLAALTLGLDFPKYCVFRRLGL
jgi:hypothetical protein